MDMNDTPDVPPPGHFIRDELEARGWSQRDFAWVLGVPEQAVTMILNGKRGISPDMAKAMGGAFDVHPDFFANLQRAYDMGRAREPDPSVARRARILGSYPIREMIKRGWFEDTSDTQLIEAQVARFFEVGSVNDVPHLAHAAKRTCYDDIPPAQLAWLFRVKQMANTTAAPRYSGKALREALPRLRRLLSEPEEARHVPRVLSECGVRFVLVESLPGAKIDGVCFWLNSSAPVIGMSMRHDRIDHFWFVLRHELEHILEKHGHNAAPILDVELEGERAGNSDVVPEQERVANAAASEFLVPRKDMLSFIARKSPFFAERDVLGFAVRMQIHPGIVVGQIQNHTKRWDFLRKYLVKIRQFVAPTAIVDGWGQVAPVSI